MRELAVPVDRGQEVVEVVGHAAGELADGLHLLGLVKLVVFLGELQLHRMPVGDVVSVQQDTPSMGPDLIERAVEAMRR